MSGAVPQPAPKRPDEKPATPASQPQLVFKPDAEQLVRVARVRTFSLLAAAVLMVVALALIISYRPPPVKLTNTEAPKASTPPVESALAARPPVPSRSAPAPRPTGVQIARSAVAAVDSLANAANERWIRARDVAAQATLTQNNAQEAADGFRSAALLADSARQDIRSASQQAERVRAASRAAESNDAFGLSVLYSAMSQYLKSLADDADDRYAYYAKSGAAAEALLRLDGPESEIQQNVAVSYLRKSEDRQAGIRRLAENVREALRNIENARR